jgi:hypothetical protein
VTSKTGRRAQRSFVTHRADLPSADRTTKDGIPVTSLPRTILDIAPDTPVRTVRRYIQRADDAKQFDLGAMHDLLDRTAGHRGRATVLLALETYEERPGFTRSGLERRFLEVVTAAGLPASSMNYFVAGYEIDAYWEDARFGVELDAYETHGSRLSFEEDRERDDALLGAGIEMTRVTGLRLDREPALVIASIRGHLARRARGHLE